MIGQLQAAIESGDDQGLQTLLAERPALANATIRWGEGGKNGSVPLHYVSEMQFEGSLGADKALPLIEILLAAGANIDAPHERHGDTPLIAAASLYAEATGKRLIEAGADVHARGLFGATALHWAAHCGLDDLAAALIGAGAEVELRDSEHKGTPADWAFHGWSDSGPRNRHRNQPRVVALLAAAGASIHSVSREDLSPDWLAALRSAMP